MTVNGGSDLYSSTGYIGYNSSVLGEVTVDGNGSTWSNSSDLVVGQYGNGTLNITEGGAVDCSHSNYIGYFPSSTGVVNVDGSGSTLTNSWEFCVGYVGKGTLNITKGGLVNCSNPNNTIFLGIVGGSTGIVNVDGVGSSWTSGSTIQVGSMGSGVVNIINGGSVRSNNCWIGDFVESTGVINVDGSSSTWKNSSDISVGGLHGTGTLNISNGGAVSVSGTTYVAVYENKSTGTINFGTGGGTLTTNSLMASPNQMTGSGTINAHGIVSDLDLVFDSKHDLNQVLNFNGIALNLSQNMNADLGAGFSDIGSLTIQEGKKISDQRGLIGYESGSIGVVSVTGEGSTWTNDMGIIVGFFGNGRLNITEGGTVNGSISIGNQPGSTGFVSVDGTGSSLTNIYSRLSVGSYDAGKYGYGTLQITGGGAVNTGVSYLGMGTVQVDGVGSTLTNCMGLYLGEIGYGILNITGGGLVASRSTCISNHSLLAIDVGTGSKFTVDKGNGTMTNNAVVRIIAGAKPTANVTYTPISATWDSSGTGIVQALGGTGNATTHEFTVSAVQPGESGAAVNIDRLSTQRVLIGDSATHWSLGASFVSTASSTPLSFTATAISDGPLDALER